MKTHILTITLFMILTFNAASAQLLPHPSGKYMAGTTIVHLIDNSRADTISKKAGQFRELMIQVWYPRDVSAKTGENAPYLPNPAILQDLLDNQYNFQEASVINGLKNVSTESVLDAPVLKSSRKFPLLIFSPGAGEPRSNYTALSQELVSHGYMIITVDHPYGGFTVLPDGRILDTSSDARGGTPEGAAELTTEWVADVSFIVDRLTSPAKDDSKLMRTITGAIDFKKIGMLGHSLGGAAALEVCRADARFSACADLDGAPFGKVKETGVQRPTLVMRNNPVYSDADLAKRGRTREVWEQMGREGKKMWDTIRPQNKNIPLYMIKVVGAGHLSFSDAPFTMPETISHFGGKIIDADLSFKIISGYTLDFFNKYLKNEPSKLLDNTKPMFIEAIIEKYNTP